MKTRLAVSILVVSGTAQAAAPAPSQPAHDAQVAAAMEAVANTQSLYQRNGGSLLKATLNSPVDANRARLNDVSFFSVATPEPKTLKKHDLVTIIIRQESAFSAKGSTDLQKSHEMEARIEEMVQLQLSRLSLRGGAAGANPPAIKYSAQRTFKGDGTVERTDSMTARVTAEVVDVKPNGTLVLQARSKTVNDEEEIEILLSGVCSASDVAPDNSVLSTQLQDLDLRKFTKGAIRDTNKRGWVPKLLDVINPF